MWNETDGYGIALGPASLGQMETGSKAAGAKQTAARAKQAKSRWESIRGHGLTVNRSKTIAATNINCDSSNT